LIAQTSKRAPSSALAQVARLDSVVLAVLALTPLGFFLAMGRRDRRRVSRRDRLPLVLRLDRPAGQVAAYRHCCTGG
jgi:hypothetical protein